MNRFARSIPGALFLLLLAALPVGATVRMDPVKLRCAGTAPALKVGEQATLTFELVAARTAQVGGLTVSSSSLAEPFLQRAASVAVTTTSPLRFEVSVLPTASPDPLLVRYEVDGEPVERKVDLAAVLVAADGRSPRTGVTRISDVSENPRGHTAEELEKMRTPEAPADGATAQRQRPPSAASRNIRVRGRFVYNRSDGLAIGVDQIRVRVFDEENNFPDDELNSGITDWDGYFDILANWDPILEDHPDLYLEFECDFGPVRVQSTVWEVDYSWATTTTWNFTGTDIQYGTIVPSDQSIHGALHIFTDIQRDFRWYSAHHGYFVPSVDVQWPDDANAYYQPFWEEIHIGPDRTWSEDTHAHEYGHHFINNFAADEDPEYCNGVCDSPICGHCLWCAETNHDAFAEGWPNWIAHVQTSSYAADYGDSALNTRNQESVGRCGGSFDDPARTEGFFGAILQDIWDDAQDADPNRLGQSDMLALGTAPIFSVVDLDEPTNSLAFFEAFKARYPAYTVALWQTAYNCRWDLDAEVPSPITGLVSTTHAPGVSSHRLSVRLDWDDSTDDWSGVSGYELLMDRPDPLPDTTFVLGDFSGALTYALPPGTYWFAVRAFDRSGKYGAWSDTGPYVLVQPTLADLTFTQPSGWSGPMVPRPAADAATNFVPMPTSLTGNVNSTYFNYAYANTGQLVGGIEPAFSRISVDGSSVGTPFFVSPNPGEVVTVVNRGPFTVHGGRHYFGGYLDQLFVWDESNKANNTWGHPWVWSPQFIGAGARVRRGTPPGATGGWGFVTDGSAVYYACDGLRTFMNGWWTCLWIAPDVDSSDYDCRLHVASSNAVAGFDVHSGASLRGPGAVDLLIMNRNTIFPAVNWDIGVTKNNSDQGSYVARQFFSGGWTLEDSAQVTLADSEYVFLSEMYLYPADAGPITATAIGNPADGPLYLAILDRTFTTGGLSDGSITSVVSDETSRARVQYTAPGSGNYAILVYRDPKDGRGSRSFVLDVERTPPDLAFASDPNWHAPLVPRAAADGTPAAVPLPASLPGNTAGTYLNSMAQNLSPVPSTIGAQAQVRLDGATLQNLAIPAVAPLASWISNQSSPVTVRGGRHTLSMRLDATTALDELEESNNAYGEQYIWSPLLLTAGVPLVRSAPPLRTGGWSDVRSGEPVLFNCDGLRTPLLINGTAHWAGVAVMPGASSGLDLNLYEVATGAKDGFDDTDCVSGWVAGESNYVLMNFGATARRMLDVGVVNANDGTQAYTIEASSASVATLPPSGAIGPFALASGRVMALTEVNLTPGDYVARLVKTSGANIDWGLSVHGLSKAMQAKSSALSASWLRPAGEEEQILFTADTTGAYCFAVWKVRETNLSLAAQYQIMITRLIVDVPDQPRPIATRLAAPTPNPFRGATVVAFDLAREGIIDIDVFSVAGARVRSLASGMRPAGAHHVEWDGRDSAGRRIPPGLYFVRLTAGGSSWVNRVIKVE